LYGTLVFYLAYFFFCRTASLCSLPFSFLGIEGYSLLDRMKQLTCCRAGKPPVGLHLDVLKGDKLIQVQDLELTCL